ncbi:acyl-CoA desaturase [Cytophagales bacterium RKSG123]|nr:acyl-CoA desaturase [Xanthovirga aplysinae]MTI30775.1 acyl-CoA desaturase [Xanthovirga aplysinae]
MNFSGAKFSKEAHADFSTTLRGRIKEYFKSNNKSRYGNSTMVWKSISLITLYLVPYILMITGVFTNSWIIWGLWLIMGIGMAGIGLSIMHDANHGAYSKNPKINTLMGYMLNFVGGSAVNWKIQHNVLHHSYTNIDGMDEDIMPVKILRFSPHQERFKIHKLQHIYAWFFYGLMTISWVTAKDFNRLKSYKKMGLTKTQNKSYNWLMTELVLSKVFYFTYILVIPILVLPQSWWLIALYFLSMHFLAGFILGIVFQPAHVMPTSDYPLPDPNGKMDNNWFIHQLQTTTNFSPDNKLLSWYVGGLNYQIEHHLFPNICHIHYKDLSKIVKKTALEFGIPYNSQPTFLRAIWNHGKMLKQLGNFDLA